jgi:hypothetical protein
MWWMVAACTGGTSGIVARDTATTGSFPDLSSDLRIADPDLGEYDASWVFPAIPVKDASDLYFGWDAVTADGWGVERDPDSYQVLALIRASTDRLDLADRLAHGDAEAVVADLWYHVEYGNTDAALSDLGIDPAELVDDGSSWLLALCDSDGDRLDVRIGLMLEPGGSTGQFFDFPDQASRYEWTSKFGSGPRTQSGYDDYTVDFSGITTDAYGQPFDGGSVDQLFVGRYPDAVEGDDLAGQVHQLEALADGWWTAPTNGGTAVDLADATGEGGPFPGFESGVAYLVGARCTTCFEPAPAWVVAVDVR